MTNNIFLILPNQLFKEIKILKNYDKIYIIEEPYYLNPNFHKLKLTLHIASITYYYDYLQSNKIDVDLITYNKINYSKLINSNTTMYHPVDKEMVKLFTKYKVNFLDNSPIFLNSIQDLKEYKKDKNYTQSDFYKKQRIKFNILIDKKNNPLFGKWSFDTENRNKFSNTYKENKLLEYDNIYIKYAQDYVNKHYKNSFGTNKVMYYPCTHLDAKRHLNNFIKYKIKDFGKYQDAMSKEVIYGNHSNISALLNIGLLTPKEVVDIIMKYFNNSTNKKEIINSVEGLIRQIIGWREYIRFIYYFYNKEIIKINYIKLNNNLPKSWFVGNTDLDLLNHLINKLKYYGYLNHIERLMVANNLMYLYNIKFKDIYKWFMICFIDSYDWVMIPNILMNINSLDSNIKYMTRVYLASDNYIKKLSDFDNKEDFKIINKLYWAFIKNNKKILKKDYGLSSQVSRI